MAEDVATGDGEGVAGPMVAFETNVASRVGMEYEHDQRWTRPARARGARDRTNGDGDNKVAEPDRLTRIACRG